MQDILDTPGHKVSLPHLFSKKVPFTHNTPTQDDPLTSICTDKTLQYNVSLFLTKQEYSHPHHAKPPPSQAPHALPIKTGVKRTKFYSKIYRNNVQSANVNLFQVTGDFNYDRSRLREILKPVRKTQVAFIFFYFWPQNSPELEMTEKQIFDGLFNNQFPASLLKRILPGFKIVVYERFSLEEEMTRLPAYMQTKLTENLISTISKTRDQLKQDWGFYGLKHIFQDLESYFYSKNG